MISYPVDVQGTRWTVLRTSDSTILERNKIWPHREGKQLKGLDPDLEYLLESFDAVPNFDPRLYNLIATENLNVSANTIRTTYSLEPVDNTARLETADVEENNRLATLLDLNREALQTRQMVGAILDHLVDITQLPPKKENRANAYITKARKVWQNRDRKQAIRDEINLNQDPDFDAGWQE